MHTSNLSALDNKHFKTLSKLGSYTTKSFSKGGGSPRAESMR